MKLKDIDEDDRREAMKQRRGLRRTLHRTYDDWKTDSDAESSKYEHEGECDCCGKWGMIRQVWYLTLETWACESCLDNEQR